MPEANKRSPVGLCSDCQFHPADLLIITDDDVATTCSDCYIAANLEVWWMDYVGPELLAAGCEGMEGICEE